MKATIEGLDVEIETRVTPSGRSYYAVMHRDIEIIAQANVCHELRQTMRLAGEIIKKWALAPNV